MSHTHTHWIGPGPCGEWPFYSVSESQGIKKKFKWRSKQMPGHKTPDMLC